MSELKKLGELIDLIDERNKDGKIKTLIGVSIDKCFIKSVANTIGNDFKSYKIVRKGQFAYGHVTSRNGGKLRLHFLKIPSEKYIRSFDEKNSPLFYNILINEKEIE